VKKSKIR